MQSGGLYTKNDVLMTVVVSFLEMHAVTTVYTLVGE